MISASCGPALRNNLANTVMMNNTARILMPATTGIYGSPNIQPPFLPAWTGCVVLQSEIFARLSSELVPPPHIGDALVVAFDHYFRAFFDCGAIVAARAEAAPHSSERKNHLAGSFFANGD